jgi:ABC-type molybdate transport system substrate-binding protein
VAGTKPMWILCSMLLLGMARGASAQQMPPWSQGKNNPAEEQGFVFRVDDIDNVPDFHGNPAKAELVLFVGGNQFMVLPELVAGFARLHPELRGRIFYETLPPGILRKQIAHQGTLTLGNLTIQVQPDVYHAGAKILAGMEQDRQVESFVSYASNQLEIMVRAGNPQHISSLRDLGRDDIRLSMPNPEWEGVARQIGESLRKSGGEELFRKVMETKVKNGSTYLTQIHHRQTAMRILNGQSDAGVTWASEVLFQKSIGNPITGIEIPASENTTAIYAAGVLLNAPHRAAARAWVDYLKSEQAQAAYRRYGFGAAPDAQGKQK